MRGRTRPLNTWLLGGALYLGAAAVGAAAAAAAAPLPADFMHSDRPLKSPVANAAFVPPATASAGAPFAATLRISQAPMQTLPILDAPIIRGRDARLFPGITLSFFTVDGILATVERGEMVKESAAASGANPAMADGRVPPSRSCSSTTPRTTRTKVLPRFCIARAKSPRCAFSSFNNRPPT